MSQILETPSGWLCFHRLAIMGLTEAGMQPFELDGDYVVCNGEIYGFRPLKRQLTEKGYSFRSGSDCEILRLCTGSTAWRCSPSWTRSSPSSSTIPSGMSSSQPGIPSAFGPVLRL